MKTPNNITPIENKGFWGNVPIIPINDDNFYVYEDDNFYYIGSMYNIGFSAKAKLAKDDCFSVDEHLQAIYEIMDEYYMEHGEYPHGELLM